MLPVRRKGFCPQALAALLILLAVVYSHEPAPAGELLHFNPDSCAEQIGTVAPEAALKASKAVVVAYEAAVARAYLEWRNLAFENLVLASRYDQWEFPAFDGFVAHSNGEKIANFSIKGVRVAGPFSIKADVVAAHIFKLAQKAAHRVEDWSEDTAWDNWLRHSPTELDVAIEMHPKEEILRRRRNLLKISKEMFSIPTVRNSIRTRIIIAVTNAEGELEHARRDQIPRAKLMELVEDHRAVVESVVILARNAAWEIAAPKVEFREYPR